jgi:hypothetical protein
MCHMCKEPFEVFWWPMTLLVVVIGNTYLQVSRCATVLVSMIFSVEMHVTLCMSSMLSFNPDWPCRSLTLRSWHGQQLASSWADICIMFSGGISREITRSPDVFA